MKAQSLFLSIICTFLILAEAEARDTYKTYMAGVPFEMEAPALPRIPDYEVSVTSFGAMGDGITDNTEVFNKVIRDVSANGGGKIIIPAGIWKTGPIYLHSNIRLHAERNALIIFDPDHKRYPIIETSFEGLNTRRCISPIYAKSETNIAITGEGVWDGSGDAWRFVKRGKMTDSQWRALTASGGVVDERGDTWFPSRESMEGYQLSDAFNNPEGLTRDEEWEAIHHWLRPVMLSFVQCRQVLLKDATFRNSPAWCLHPLSCEDITIDNLKVFNPWHSQNGDGLDLESCNRALVVNNLFDVGDDAICLKSGKDRDGRERAEPCRNVVIRHNTVLHGHGGFVVGSEMSGGISNIYVADCLFLGTDVGLRFKSTRGRGGVVENIHIERVNMSAIPTEPLLFDLFYSGKSAVEDLEEGTVAAAQTIPPVTEETPVFRRIYIKDVQCKGARRAMFFNGLPEMKIKDVRIENVTITSRLGAEINYAENVHLRHVRIIPETGEPLTQKHTTNLTQD